MNYLRISLSGNRWSSLSTPVLRGGIRRCSTLTTTSPLPKLSLRERLRDNEELIYQVSVQCQTVGTWIGGGTGFIAGFNSTNDLLGVVFITSLGAVSGSILGALAPLIAAVGIPV